MFLNYHAIDDILELSLPIETIFSRSLKSKKKNL